MKRRKETDLWALIYKIKVIVKLVLYRESASLSLYRLKVRKESICVSAL